MRVFLSTYGSRGDVEPVLALALELQRSGAEVTVCAPPDFAGLLAGFGVPMVPLGRSAEALTKAAPPPSSIPEHAAELIAAQFEVVSEAASGYDVLVATGMVPAAAGALSVAELLGLRSVSVTFQQLTLPSPTHRPLAFPGRPFPPDVTDSRTLWDLDAESNNVLFAEALNRRRTKHGLLPVDNIRDYVIGDQPWLATDPLLDPWQESTAFDVVQTGAWILPDQRPLPDDLAEFLAAGDAPVFVGFGSMPMHSSADAARVAIEAVRAQGRRTILRRGWANLALIDDQDDCFAVDEINQQKLFGHVAAVVHHGGAGTTMTTTRAGTPQVVVPQAADQPYWAGRVAELGIGAAHDGPALTFESPSAALETALAPATGVRAKEVAGLIRTDGTAVAAKLLLDGSR
ncbi:glycosyltransferase [Kribbella sp. CA-293567]|uniref:glycosyltransferase n=1 Tax=Kribbella sp. CA-293567 TaxID=3002436 RepID=UPI0022DD46E9|nr:glycosyltransferase [Kribbella sp. CA-293567]WBQ05070.1 glycosyltransferase [Kribbella sp. CA-293567]